MSEKGATAGLTCCLMLKSTRCILRWEMVLLMAFAPFQGVLAQFDIVPTDSLVEVFGVDSITRVFQIDFPNASGDSLGLSWRWVDGGWTEGWDVNLCDLGECYTGVPADADMLPMGPEGAGFLKLIVNSLEIEGHCFLHFWVWPTGNQDALVHVYFDLMNDAAVGISDALQSARTEFSVHPIPCPVGRPLHITGSTHGPDELCVQLFDAQGALVPCSVEGHGGDWSIETNRLSPGFYLLKLDEHKPPLRLLME